MGDGALLLGVALGGQVDVGGLGGGAGEHRDAERELRGADSARFQPSGSSKSRTGSTSPRISGLELAGLEGGADLVGGAARLGRGEAGPEVLGAADLAEAAAVRGAGDLVEPAALHAVEAEDVGEAEQRLGDLLAVVAGEHPLAPDDHDRPGVAQRVREAGGVGFGVAGADRASEGPR